MVGMSNTSAKRDLYLANTNSIMPDCFRRNKNKAAAFSPVTLETEPTTASHTQGQALEQVTMSCILHELQSHPKHETETIQEYEKISFISVHICVSAGVDVYYIHLGLYRSQGATDSLNWQLKNEEISGALLNCCDIAQQKCEKAREMAQQ